MAGQDDKDLDKDLDAAERALGTEPRAGESAAEARARRDWDDRLAPLALAIPAADPPADMFGRIESALDREADTAKIVRLAERRARRWRAVAVATGGIAACLVVVVAGLLALSPVNVAPPTAPQQSYVALVTPEGGEGPAMIVEVRFSDLVGESQTGTVTVQPLRVAAPQGRVLELWRIPPGQAPQSVGLVDPQSMTRLNVAAEPGDIMAITVEPPGGAPGGVPSGPPILSGALVPAR
jgi:anti-sigma-K factor RskA